MPDRVARGALLAAGLVLQLPPTPAAAAATAGFYTVPGCRAYDTRGPDAPSIHAWGVGAQPERTIVVAGKCGVPAGATAVVLNVTAVSPNGPGFLTVFPADDSFPGTYTVGFRGPDNPILRGVGPPRAGNVVVGLSGDPVVESDPPAGAFKVFASMGGCSQGCFVHLVVDVTGYFDD